MKLIDKPHCKKHEVYTQGCIGCRIKASQVPLTEEQITNRAKLYGGTINLRDLQKGVSIYSTTDGDKVVPHGHDTVATDPSKHATARKSAQISELKKLLKAIRNSGAEDTQRSLQADVDTITELFS